MTFPTAEESHTIATANKKAAVALKESQRAEALAQDAVQLTEVEAVIREASLLGQFSARFPSTIRRGVRAQLETLGYRIPAPRFITWD